MAVIAIPGRTPITDSCPTFPGGALAVTPSDADTFANPVAIYIGGSGNISVAPGNGVNPAITVAVLAGTMLPFTVLSVRATGTTATGIVAVF